MKTLIFSSDQFKSVADITRPFIKTNGDLIYRGLPSYNKEAKWGTEEFNEISRITGKYCLDLMNEMNDGDLLLYCDSDVLLFENTEWFADQIEDNDFIFQSDKKTACMGFYVVKVSDKTKSVISACIDEMKDNKDNFQVVFNKIYNRFNIKYDFFNEEEVWNYGVVGDIWNGEEFDLPKNIKAFHANYTIGIDNKVKLLNKAIEKYASHHTNN